MKVKGCRHPCRADPQHTRKQSQGIHRRHEENSSENLEKLLNKASLIICGSARNGWWPQWLLLRVAALRSEDSAYHINSYHLFLTCTHCILRAGSIYMSHIILRILYILSIYYIYYILSRVGGYA
jgi:hypothetical protein